MEFFKRLDNRTKTRIFIFGFLTIIFLVFFVWKTIISRGQITFIATPPYTVEIVGKEPRICLEARCSIPTSSGPVTYLATKENFRPISSTVRVPILSKTEIDLIFQSIPQLIQSRKIDISTPTNEYQLTLNPNNGNYMLTASDQDSPIVYFQKSLINPQFFDFKNHILIISETDNYLINKIRKSRTILTEFPSNATNISIAPNGEEFIYNLPNSTTYLYYSTTGISKSLNYQTSNTVLTWTNNNRLIVATLNNSQPQRLQFSFYDPANDVTYEIGSFNEITVLPSLIHAISDTVIYIEVGDNYYRLQG